MINCQDSESDGALLDNSMDASIVVKIDPEGIRRSSRARALTVKKENADVKPLEFPNECDHLEFPDPRERVRDPKLLDRLHEFLQDVGTNPNDIVFTDSYSLWKQEIVNYEPKLLNDDAEVCEVKLDFFGDLPGFNTDYEESSEEKEMPVLEPVFSWMDDKKPGEDMTNHVGSGNVLVEPSCCSLENNDLNDADEDVGILNKVEIKIEID